MFSSHLFIDVVRPLVRSDAKDSVRTVGANLVFNCAFATAAQLAAERTEGIAPALS
jgi:hypothetical protein